MRHLRFTVDTMTLSIIAILTWKRAQQSQTPLAVPHPVGPTLPLRNIVLLNATALSKPT